MTMISLIKRCPKIADRKMQHSQKIQHKCTPTYKFPCYILWYGSFFQWFGWAAIRRFRIFAVGKTVPLRILASIVLFQTVATNILPHTNMMMIFYSPIRKKSKYWKRKILLVVSSPTILWLLYNLSKKTYLQNQAEVENNRRDANCW